MIIQGLVEFTPPGEKLPITDPARTITRYITTDFVYDFIPLIPLQIVPLDRNRQYIFYLLKMIRLKKGFKILEVPAMMEKIKKYYQDSL